jgi:Mn2+/Fe2+ NRAMP family transporter
LKGYDEPEILPSSTYPICLTSADGGHYSIIAGATVVGLALGYTPINPIQMLIWSAVFNGIVAVPIMTVMMVVVTRLSVMGRFSARPTLTFFGWAGTALMAVTVAALFWSSIG